MKQEIQTYLNSVQSICPELTETELEAFGLRLQVKVLNKKDYVYKYNEVQKEMAFIVKGLIRAYYIDDRGDERTVRFYAEGDYAIHYASFLLQQPSKYYGQCLEPTTVVCLSFEVLQWVYGQSVSFERYGRLVAEAILKIQQERIESFVFQTAEQRYLNFVRQNPDMFNRVSISHLCSYLGVERQTITRFRQKLSRS